MNHRGLILFSFTIFGINLTAYAAGRDIIMRTFSVVSNKASYEPVESTDFIKVRIKLSCSGINLRQVVNPLARDAILIPRLVLTTPNGVRRTFTLDSGLSNGKKLSGKLGTSCLELTDEIKEDDLVLGCQSIEDSDCTPAKASAFRAVGSAFGYLNFTIPFDQGDVGDFWSDKSSSEAKPNLIFSMEQQLEVPRQHSPFYGFAGPLTFNQSPPEWDPNNREVLIDATLFGEEGFCGGYHSPLILFFDQKRPEYTGIANFDFFGSKGSVYWPEKGASAYFLAIDRNKNGIIDHSRELFGNVAGSYRDGFQALSEIDENKDGIINSKDRLFNKLVLWRDSTGGKKSLKKDVMPLSAKGVQSLALKNKKIIRIYGGRAEDRAESEFVYIEPMKNSKKIGKLIDVWFARPTFLTER